MKEVLFPCHQILYNHWLNVLDTSALKGRTAQSWATHNTRTATAPKWLLPYPECYRPPPAAFWEKRNFIPLPPVRVVAPQCTCGERCSSEPDLTHTLKFAEHCNWLKRWKTGAGKEGINIVKGSSIRCSCFSPALHLYSVQINFTWSPYAVFGCCIN